MATKKEVYEKLDALAAEYENLRKMVEATYNSRKSKKKLRDCSWQEIAEIAKDNPEDVFDVGDEKEIPLLSGEVLTAVIVGFKHDDLEDGENVAGITFGLKGIPDGWFEMNNTNTTESGWRGCKMRNTYMDRFYNLLPEDLRNVIKTVIKVTGDEDGDIVGTEDNLFLFSEVEVFGTSEHSVSGEGEQYEYFKTEENRKKYRDGYSSSFSWWLRSPYFGNSTYFCSVVNSGYCGNSVASSAYGVVFGFCI